MEYRWHYPQKDMMVNKPKQKGTKAETAVVSWAHKHGYYLADRIALSGSNDRGDVLVTRGVVVQVKDGYTNQKEPSDLQIGNWLDELEAQKKAGQHELGLLVHKRHMKGDPDDWRWYISAQDFRLLFHTRTAPVYSMVPGYAVLDLVAAAGYTKPDFYLKGN